MEVINEDPLKASYVEKIFKNPEYYSGYYLCQIDGNLNNVVVGASPPCSYPSYDYGCHRIGRFGDIKAVVDFLWHPQWLVSWVASFHPWLLGEQTNDKD
jgi:hypothetical protein